MMAHDPRAIYDRTAEVPQGLLDEVITEERLAWDYGRKILCTAVPDFPAWDEYDATAKQKVKGYEEGFREALRPSAR